MTVGIPPRLTLDGLMRMSRSELDKLYRSSELGPLPDGDSAGRATIPSPRGGARAWEPLFSIFWSGKIFERDTKDASRGRLINKTLIGRCFPASVYLADSRLDGKKSIVIDYKECWTPVIRSVRDEIRRVDRDLYLGYAYVGQWQALAFALDFAKTTIEEKTVIAQTLPAPQTP